MMQVLRMRFDAPLMSFGAPIVDNYGVIQDFPGLSLLTGLVGNALGYDHRDADALNRLQERLRYAVCREVVGEKICDFQTVDFSQGTEDLKIAKVVGWTTRGKIEQRAGSDDTLRQKHIRYRDYLADARYSLAVALDPPDEAPDLRDIAGALAEPERPLFIGRKCCLPSAPLLIDVCEVPSLLIALEEIPAPDGTRGQPLAVWWEDGDVDEGGRPSTVEPVSDERDWSTQLHGGQRVVRRSTLIRADPAEATRDVR